MIAKIVMWLDFVHVYVFNDWKNNWNDSTYSIGIYNFKYYNTVVTWSLISFKAVLKDI